MVQLLDVTGLQASLIIEFSNPDREGSEQDFVDLCLLRYSS